MTRILTVGAAQLGPIARNESRQTVVNRLIDLMKQAHGMGCNLVVYPELALTTFFPRWYMEDPAEVEAFFETEMPNEATQPLFDLAQQLGIGFHLGYAERVVENDVVHHYNTAILVGHLLSMQAGAYQNGTWVVGVAKAGCEEGCDLIGHSCIIAPSGEVVAKARTVEDELVVARCDLDAGLPYKNTIFNFAAHRRPEHYQRICQQTGVQVPDFKLSM